MPATPDEMRLIKERFADLFISYQRGELDLPDALAAVRDFEIPIEMPTPDAASTPPEGSDAGDTGDAGGDGSEEPAPVADAPEGDPQPDEAALAEAQAELDAALATALARRDW